MSLVYVQHRNVVVRDWKDKGSYASWGKEAEFVIDGVALDTSLRWGYDAIQIAPAILEGDEVWVLYVTYRSGDSFGSYTGQGEIIWVFIDQMVAEKALETLRSKCGRTSSFDFVDEDGEELHLCDPTANDYFARVEGIHLKKCIVGECPPSQY